MWAIGCMYYAMLFGNLPFWAETEDEFVNKIVNSPLKFPSEVAVSEECKEILRGMLHKQN